MLRYFLETQLTIEINPKIKFCESLKIRMLFKESDI